jgi:hypothetical protein
LREMLRGKPFISTRWRRTAEITLEATPLVM